MTVPPPLAKPEATALSDTYCDQFYLFIYLFNFNVAMYFSDRLNDGVVGRVKSPQDLQPIFKLYAVKPIMASDWKWTWGRRRSDFHALLVTNSQRMLFF